MATSGTYVTEVPLKGTAEKHYKRWKSENHLFPDTIGHHIQNVTVHEGEWDSHGGIKIWNYTLGIYLLIPSNFLNIHLIFYIYDTSKFKYTAAHKCVIAYEHDLNLINDHMHIKMENRRYTRRRER